MTLLHENRVMPVRIASCAALVIKTCGDGHNIICMTTHLLHQGSNNKQKYIDEYFICKEMVASSQNNTRTKRYFIF